MLYGPSERQYIVWVQKTAQKATKSDSHKREGHCAKESLDSVIIPN